MSIQELYNQTCTAIVKAAADAQASQFHELGNAIARLYDAFKHEQTVLTGATDIGDRTTITDRILGEVMRARLEYRNVAAFVSPEFEADLEKAQTDIFAVLGHRER